MSDQIADDTTSEEDQTRSTFPTTEEERAGAVPGSAEATAVALSLATAHGNPVVERSKVPQRKKIKRKKKNKPPSTEQATQTDK